MERCYGSLSAGCTSGATRLLTRRAARIAVLVAALSCHDRGYGPDPIPRSHLRREALGCFEATYSPVRRPLSFGPRFFELDSTSVRRAGYPAFRAVKLFRNQYADSESSYNERVWFADSASDSIRVLISDGYGGGLLVFELASRDSLRGVAWQIADVREWKRPIGSILVHKLDCSELR